MYHTTEFVPVGEVEIVAGCYSCIILLSLASDCNFRIRVDEEYGLQLGIFCGRTLDAAIDALLVAFPSLGKPQIKQLCEAPKTEQFAEC